MPEQIEELDLFLNGGYVHYGTRVRRRARAVWMSHQGETVAQISRRLNISQRSIRKWFKIYKKQDLAGLKGKYFYRNTAE